MPAARRPTMPGPPRRSRALAGRSTRRCYRAYDSRFRGISDGFFVSPNPIFSLVSLNFMRCRNEYLLAYILIGLVVHIFGMEETKVTITYLSQIRRGKDPLFFDKPLPE